MQNDDVAAKLEPSAIEARIKELRMGRLTVQTKPGAEVSVRQTRHEFPFGTAITRALAENEATAMPASERQKFLEVLGENFNYAVHEDSLKWYDCEKQDGVVDYTSADRIWDLCRERDIPMRGHCIFWEKDEHVPAWQKQLDNERLRASVQRRAIGVTEHFKGRISEFDLNNEMINGDFYRRRLGYGIVNEMAWMAKAGNPDARLFVNDYGILYDGGFNAKTYLVQIRNLLDMGVPLSGIGVQGHGGTYLSIPLSASHIQETLDKLARFGLPIKITECLFDMDDERMQAEEMRKVFPIYFAHPAIEAILMWGFWAGAHWKPWAALWRKDWTLTPQGEVFRDLVYNQWWTKASGKADASGTFQTDAFFGNYEVAAKGVKRNVTLSKNDKSVTVEID